MTDDPYKDLAEDYDKMKFKGPDQDLGFRYVNTRIAANPRRLRVYATE
jgi:hypothetical protein